MKEKIRKMINKEVVIHITTEEQLDTLNNIVKELGLIPLRGRYKNEINKGDFCVHIMTPSCAYSDLYWYIAQGIKVIEFKDLCKNNETIVIYRKGNETIALDKITGKKAVAKCSPDDTYDFKIGAKLAFERLTKNVTFRVLCVKSASIYNPSYTKGKVYEFVDGVTNWDNGFNSSKYASYVEFIKRNPFWANKFVELKDGDNPAEILKKYDEIKTGDTVMVINNGKTYTKYSKWVEHYITGDSRYKWDMGNTPDNGSIGKVIQVGPWEYGSSINNHLLALINIENRYYLIGIEGLKKC